MGNWAIRGVLLNIFPHIFQLIELGVRLIAYYLFIYMVLRHNTIK